MSNERELDVHLTDDGFVHIEPSDGKGCIVLVWPDALRLAIMMQGMSAGAAHLIDVEQETFTRLVHQYREEAEQKTRAWIEGSDIP